MSKKKENVTLRKLTKSDLSDAMRLKDAEGWNQTENDWEVFLKGARNVNFVAKSEGKTVGTVTAINFENKVAWLGMMIVDKAYRGMGISKNLMTTAIEGLKRGHCKSIKLDATPLGRPVYVKLGFFEEYTIYRLIHPNLNLQLLPEMDTAGIEPAAEKDIQDIIDLDAGVFGANRSDLILHMINNNPEKSFVLKENGKIKGFALGRDGDRFTQVGPVVAVHDSDAERLTGKALQSLDGQPVVIDLLADKGFLLNRLVKSGFENQRPLYRMYLEHNPYPGKPQYLYAICGPEFG